MVAIFFMRGSDVLKPGKPTPHHADDLVILAPSWLAQQKLLNVCNESVLSLDMKFNISASMTMHGLCTVKYKVV